MKIAQFIAGSGTWGDITPDTMNEKGLGGRETALLNLGIEWADQGHEVICFVPTEKPYYKDYGTGHRQHGSLRLVDYRFAVDYLTNFGANVLVSWEEPRIMGIKGVRDNVDFGIIEMQVANMQTTPELDSVTDAYAVLSQWAGEYLTLQEPNIDPDKIVIFPNGVDLKRYGDRPHNSLSDRMHFHYSSSPDRGLFHLLHMWPQIRSEFPGSVLHVCYGIEHWIEQIRWSHNMQAEMALDIEQGLRQEGVIYHGKVGQNKLASIQKGSNALLYPCDPIQPTETGCITVVEAGAAYSPSIITDADCLGSEFGESAVVNPLPLDYDEYISSIVQVCGDEELYVKYQELGRELAESRSWSKIALDWLNLFEAANERSS